MDIDTQKCIICKDTHKKSINSACSLHSITKIRESVLIRTQYGENTHKILYESIKNKPDHEILLDKSVYHRDCYAELTSASKN